MRRLLIRLVALLVLLVLVIFAYQAVRTVLALRQTKNATHELSGEVRRNDIGAVKQTLRTIEHSSDTARHNSDNFLWNAAASLPWVGDDVAALQVMSRAFSDASHGAAAPANTLLARVQGDSLRGPDGRLDLSAISDLGPSLQTIRTSLQGATRDVDALDTDKLLGPLAEVTTSVQGQLDSMLAAAQGGETVTRLLPAMLGADGPRRYLLVVQNNAEIRSTGGLPGSLSILKAQDGKLTLGAQHSVDDFDELNHPVLPLTDEEKALFGDNLGENIRDTNLTPDFPRAAELMRALYKRSFATHLDGVVAVDPVVLSGLLRATGPVKVNHERFTGSNVVPKLMHDVYQRFDKRTKQADYFNRVARGVFNTLVTRHVEPLKVLRKLGKGVAQRRFLVWSTHPEEQSALADATIGGALPRDTGNVPQVGLYLNDATASKIEYFLDYQASVRSAGCTASGRQTLQVGMVLTSSAPLRGYQLSPYMTGFGRYAAKGTIRMNLRMYAPAGGEITSMTANGQPVRVATREHDGRQVAIVAMFIKAREEVRLSAEIRTKPGQRGNPELRWTPAVRTRTSGVTATSSC